MPPPDALVRTTERGTKVKGASELTPSRLRTLVSRTALSTHFPLPWPFFSTTNSLAEENPTPLPLRFSKPLFNFVVYDFPKTSKLGGDPQAKKEEWESGEARDFHSRNPVLPWAGLPIPGQSRLRWFFRVWGGVVPGQTVRRRPLRIFPQRPAEMFGIFGATPPPPRPKPRSGPTKSPRARRRSQEQGGADRTRTDGDIFPSRDTRKGWRALQEPRSTTHAS